MREMIAESARRLIDAVRATTHECGFDIERASLLVNETAARKGTVLACGNGGSAATAQHFVAELVGRYRKERTPLPAIALTADSSIVTALGNDYGFENIFARQVRAFGNPENLLVAFSTSGQSPNVLAALAAARECGMKTIALTGARGTGLKALADVCIAIPSAETARIQELHDFTIHVWCEALDATLGGGNNA